MIWYWLTQIGLILTAVLVLAIGTLYLFYQKRFRYWRDRNIPYLEPSFPFGNIGESSKISIAEITRRMYEQTKHEKIYGMWQMYRPALLINDLDFIKSVLVSDFMSFHDHGFYVNEKDDPLKAHIGSLEGTAWRNLRVKLTPTFTSGKMKMMFPIFVECGDELKDVLRSSAEKNEVVEFREIFARYATDVIASCAFGVQANSLRNPDAIFRKMGSKVFEPTTTTLIKGLIAFLIPDLARLLKIVMTPKEVEKFFMNAIRETIDYREANNIERKDILQLLIQLMKKGYIEDVDSSDKTQADKTPFTFEQLAAQAFMFFVGGFENTSTTMQYILYELAVNPEIQKRLRDEIKSTLTKHGGKLTYEGVHEIEYLGRVMEETLRKHPVAPGLPRICTKEHKFPGYDFTLEKGITVMVPLYGLQMDEKYFPDPEKFDPDRFTEEAKSSRPYFAYIPFGDGPRVCIGQRFAVMQIRVAIISVLLNYQVDVAPGLTQIPVEIDPNSFAFAPKGGMPLKLSLIDT